MKFPDCYGKETSEKHMPSLTASNQKGHGITITCFQCERWRLIYFKNVLPHLIKKLKQMTSSSHAEPLKKLSINYTRANLTCQVLSRL